MNKPTTLIYAVFACLSLASCLAQASSLFYLSSAGAGQGAAPVSPQETLKFLPSGGSFHIWVQPDTLFTGISLEVQSTGSAIRFTDSTVHNPVVGADMRWLPGLIRDGTVTDTKVSRIEGGALAPLTGFGTGIGPATSSSDPLYETPGGFLFATIDFDVLQPATTATVSISVGHNLLSDTSGVASGSLLFGVADGPVMNSPGSTGSVIDLKLEPKPLHPADFDSDGDVDGRDFLTWQAGMGMTSGATRTDGDANLDGKVDGDDLGIWETQFGTVPTGPISATFIVPESKTLHLAMLGVIIGLALTQRRRIRLSPPLGVLS